MKKLQSILAILIMFFSFYVKGQYAGLDAPYSHQSMNIYSSNYSDRGSELILDKCGNTYTTIIIGNQVWLKENLNTTLYSNGDPISDGTHRGDISKESQPRYWFDYNNNAEMGYGKLYTWHVIKDTRGICPTNFHVATGDDWSELIEHLGGPAVAAEAIKTGDNEIWPQSNFTSTAQSFAAMPGRLRPSDESYCLLEAVAFWWIDQATSSIEASAYMITSESSAITSIYKSKNTGLSIRCVMDK